MKAFSLLFLAFVPCFVSCRTNSEESSRPEVRLKPSVLDFGRVRAEAEPVVLEFRIENTGPRRLTIEKILPSCGCTLCELPSDAIPPNSSLPASVKVFLAGRSGDFKQEIWIKIAGEKSFRFLPIKGYVDDVLSFSGQTIRCAADKVDRVVETQFDLTVRNLTNIEFDTACFPDGVTMKEISHAAAQDGFVLQMLLRVQVPSGRDSYAFDLVLRPKAGNILPLVIPVQCFVVE